MSFLDVLRDFYFRAEDKYYAFLDWLDTKIPVYWFIEPIDRFVPSFAVIALLFFFLFIWFFFVLLQGTLFSPKTTLSFQVTDNQGKPLEGTVVSIKYKDRIKNLETAENGFTKSSIIETGTQVFYSVKKPGFTPEEVRDSITLSEKEQVIKISFTPKPKYKEISFSILNSKGELVTKIVNLEFFCSNTDVEPPAGMTIISGIASVQVPVDCGQLKVSVSATGFESVFNKPLSDKGSIFLQEKEEKPVENGEILVNVYFNGSLVEGESIEVQLFKSFGTGTGSFIEETTTVTGQTQFEVSPGTYFVKISSTNRFALTQSNDFSLSSSEKKSVSLNLEEKIIGKIKVRVLNSNNQPVENAKVSLLSGNTETEFRVTSNENPIVEFNIKQDKEFSVVIDHEDYCIERIEGVRINADPLTVKLEKNTGQCGSILFVKVLDSDGFPVRNASVSLFGGEGQSLGRSEKKTDINGIAEFPGVSAGRYRAFAFKGFTSGWSETKQFTRRERNPEPFVVRLEIPDASLKVFVKDREENPALFANVSVFDADTKELIAGPLPVENSDGSISFRVKAGMPVYIVVKKDGMADFVSRVIKILPEKENMLSVVLEPEIISGKIKAELEGVYRENKLATVLSPGNTYTARFKLSIPKLNNFSRFLFHVRTGDDNRIMEQDLLFLKSVRAPGATRKLSGTSFFPVEGIERDTKYLSNDGAKWVNVLWSDFSHGVIEVEADIVVRREATPGKKLLLKWRMAAEKMSGGVERDPKDERAGNSLSIKELYSNVKTKVLEIGIESLCDNNWCFTASILDVDQDILETVQDTFNARVGKNYKLTFQLVNTGKLAGDIFSDTELRISSPEKAVSFGSYSIVGADNRQVQGKATEFETKWVEVQTITRNKSVSGEIYFSPKKAVSSTILIQLKSGQQIVLEKEVFIESISEKEMFAEFEQNNRFKPEPLVLPSGLEQVLRVRVKDSETNLELENVRVKARDKSGSIINTAKTSSIGIAEIKIPALLPGETITLQFEKPNYAVYEAKIRVKESVLEFMPSSLGFALNPKTVTSLTQKVRVSNKTSITQKIEDIKLVGKFNDKINEEALKDWFNAQYKGREIQENSETELQVQISLSQAGMLLTSPESFNAKLVVTTTALSQKWENELPVNISIGISGQVDNPDCLKVSLSKWIDSTEGQPVRKEVTIQNNCTVNGSPIELRNLKARADFESNPIGDFFIEVQGKQSQIGEGFSQLILGNIGKGETLHGLLEFRADGGVIGQQNAIIFLSAENPLEQKSEVLKKQIEAIIDIVNLNQCISVNKDLLLMKENGSDAFEVSTNDCKGSIEFEIESELELSKNKFSLPETDAREISVFAGKALPGQYPITIKAKGAGENQFSFKKLVRARIETDGCITPDKYEYNILDDPANPFDGYDVGELINKCYSKKVSFNVHVNEKDLFKAMKTGATWAAVGFVYGGLQGLFGGAGKTVTAGLQESNTETIYTPTGLQVLGGMENILGVATTVLGVNNPIQGALLGFIGGTAFAYSQQKEYDFPFDTELGSMTIDELKLLLLDKMQDIESTDITLKTGEEKIVVLPENEVKARTIEMFFENTGSVSNPGPESPLYRLLKVMGRSLEYKEEYNTKEKPDLDIFEPEIKSQDPFTKKFRLQFNAAKKIEKPPTVNTPQTCLLEGKTGQTGSNAKWLPKIKLAWNWNEIGKDTCTEEGEGIYCDATQFTISVLKRINEIDSVLAGQSFSCPTSKNLLAEKKQGLSELEKDFGVTNITVEKDKSDAIVKAVIESSNNKKTTANVKISLEGITSGQTIQCQSKPNGETVNILSRAQVECRFQSIPEGKFKAKAELSVDLFSCGVECKNFDAENDALSAEFEASNTAGFVKCEPFSTSRLADFIEANPNNQNLKQAKNLASFNALLVKDGYTQDFINDFHEYSTSKSFFNTPTFYLRENGLGEIFSDPERFKFKAASLSAGHGMLPAGKYRVDINITYDNANWQLFENSQPSAKIVVSFSRLEAPNPDNPLYHLPFDGLIGVYSDNGRQGYGVNFRQTTQKTVNINNSILQPLNTSTIAGSVPVSDGWINSALIDDFSITNNQKRGVVLELSKDSSGYTLNFAPTKATPVILRVNAGNSSNAYAFYSLSVDGQVQQSTSNLSFWNGLGLRCKDFSDKEIGEVFNNTPDIRGAVGKTQCSTSFLPSQYGFEWCELNRSGSVFLGTIFFTPLLSTSLLREADSKDNMEFISPTETGAQIELSGLQGVTLNSLQDAIKLVKQEKLCVTQSDDSVTEFFWNPAKVFEPLEPTIQSIPGQCIPPFREPGTT